MKGEDLIYLALWLFDLHSDPRSRENEISEVQKLENSLWDES
jgi:hypothetical protein